MEHLIIVKAVFAVYSGAGAALFAALARRESWRSGGRWAGLGVALLFGIMAMGEAARVVAAVTL